MAHVSDLWGDYLNGVRNPVWSDKYEAYRRFVNPTEDAYERQWCGRCQEYAGNDHGMIGPQLICDTDCYDGRLRDPTMFRRYWERLLNMEPSDLIPCTWCGFSATAMCESCDRTNGPASALCLHCENELSACRLCWATSYVKQQRKPTFTDCVIQKRNNNVKCSTCAKRPATQRCAGCGTIPYCSPECQSDDWEHHKSVCKMLRKGCKVFCIYEWQQQAKNECLAWAVEHGERERYYKCFGNGE